MQAIREQLKDQGQPVEIDGLRMQFADGWGLARPSNTEPVLSMRFEGRTEADMLTYRDLFFDVLRNFPEIDLEAMT
jgi:phosphomannomutase